MTSLRHLHAHLTPEHIRQSNLIEDIDDLTADAVGEAAWCWLLAQDRITPDHVRHLHRIVTAHQFDLVPVERGHWRTCPVWVGGREGAPYSQLPALMGVWCVSLALALGGGGPDIDPQAHHVAFEHIHPFVDGNGRTGRLLMWWHQVRLGQQPTLLRADERQDYYRWFR